MNLNTTSFGLMCHGTEVINAGARIPFLMEFLKGKRVLHVGCTDYLHFDPNNNLHILLSSHVEHLHGYDIDKEGIATLAKYVSKPLFYEYSKVQAESYDVVLVPEVLEHVINAGLFLKEMMALNANDIMLMTPNLIETIKHNAGKFGWVKDENGVDRYIETVHDDHVCFYSPKTLATLVEKSIAAYYPGKWMLGPIFNCDLSIGCIMRKTTVAS